MYELKIFKTKGGDAKPYTIQIFYTTNLKIIHNNYGLKNKFYTITKLETINGKKNATLIDCK